ncbi:unnamed protein product [Eretmochelys imbricata]
MHWESPAETPFRPLERVCLHTASIATSCTGQLLLSCSLEGCSHPALTGKLLPDGGCIFTMYLGAAEARGETPPRVQIIQQPIPQQPMTVFQQIPGILSPFTQPVRPGHVREDLIEFMMIQNAQMHQVIMNNMTMAALTSFGFNPAPTAAQVNLVPLHTEDEEADVVFHHHYAPYPSTTPSPPWQPLAQPPAWAQEPPSIRHVGLDPHPAPAGRIREDKVVPPPPPPSATGTVGADVPPATEYYDYTQGKL